MTRYFSAVWLPLNPTDYNLAVADITTYNKVDIRDIAIAARNFGAIDP